MASHPICRWRRNVVCLTPIVIARLSPYCTRKQSWVSGKDEAPRNKAVPSILYSTLCTSYRIKPRVYRNVTSGCSHPRIPISPVLTPCNKNTQYVYSNKLWTVCRICVFAQVRALRMSKQVSPSLAPRSPGQQLEVPPTLHRIDCGLAQIRLGALMRHRRGRVKEEREDREGENSIFSYFLRDQLPPGPRGIFVTVYFLQSTGQIWSSHK
jgi:hypothetical protein